MPQQPKADRVLVAVAVVVMVLLLVVLYRIHISIVHFQLNTQEVMKQGVELKLNTQEMKSDLRGWDFGSFKIETVKGLK